LAECAQPAGAVALAGLPGALRFRVGDHQVVYTVDEGEVLILVIDVDHRSVQ
jgi:mRNA interferase RelE/StbE